MAKRSIAATAAQLPLFQPESSWTPPRLADLPDWWEADRVCVDVETCDLELKALGPGVRRGAYIVGYCVAVEDGPKMYLPVRHQNGGNMDPAQVHRYIKYNAARFSGTLVGANLSYDLDFLAEEGIEFPNVRWFRDVLLAAPLINELHMSYSLEAVATRIGLPGKDESQLLEALAAHGFTGRDAKAGLFSLHSKHVGAYGEQDAALPLDVLRRQEREIDEQGLQQIFDLESRLMPILVKMRRRGVRVNEDKLAAIEGWAAHEQREAIKDANTFLTRRLGWEDITKASAIAPALRDLGILTPKTAKGADSITADFLNGLDHPIGECLRRAKKMSTLRTTFVGGTRKHIVNGRIHCTFNQMKRQSDDGDDTEGAAFGRLSSSDPNLQNQPARDPEIGPRWRDIYEPDFGVWGALDYSQQEPRQAVHFAVKAGPKLIGLRAWEAAKEAARRYRDDPSTDFHQMMADMAGIPRKPAKEIYLGLSYGMGGPKLCRKLGLPTKVIEVRGVPREVAGDEGQALLDQFDERVPFIRKTAAAAEQRARRKGFIVTLLGRHCRFPLDGNGGYDWTHKAFNRLIQGSSADQTKQAVIELDAAGYYIQLQVHDEIDGSFETPSAARAAGDIMENCVPLEVPSKVDVETGTSWGDSM